MNPRRYSHALIHQASVRERIFRLLLHRPLAPSFTVGLLAIALVTPASLYAQSFTAAMTGTVRDQSGAVVPGATIVIRNTGANEVRTLKSDDNGLYTADQLLPGQYQLSVTAPNFKGYVENGITLDGSQRAEHNAQLELGSIDQTVQVNAAQIAVDTQTANREVTLESKQIESFPTSFRNPLYVVQNTAGVVSVRTGLTASPSDQNQNRFSLNGGP